MCSGCGKKMIIKDKNKLKLKTKSKILVLGLTLVILAGVFGLAGRADAQTETKGVCIIVYSDGVTTRRSNMTAEECPESLAQQEGIRSVQFELYSATNPNPDPSSTAKVTTRTENWKKTAFEKDLDDSCNILWASTWGSCLVLIFYYTFFQLPAFLLTISAQFFNAMISIGIDSSRTGSSSFIPLAWAIVRDFSNIFFILVLLYVAIQTILGMGHETKKVVVNVVIMALLINFSMFFTKVVIDSSNILALVFYNKLDVKPATGVQREYTSSTVNNEKDVSGALYEKFDATRMITGDFLDRAKTTTINGQTHK